MKFQSSAPVWHVQTLLLTRLGQQLDVCLVIFDESSQHLQIWEVGTPVQSHANVEVFELHKG